jgi:sarcosine oxidase delta subunit
MAPAAPPAQHSDRHHPPTHENHCRRFWNLASEIVTDHISVTSSRIEEPDVV